MVGAWFRRGEGTSPNGLGDPTPTLRYGSLWIDKSTAPWDHSLLFKTGSKVGKRHTGSKPAQQDFSFLPILTKGDLDAVHVKVQNQVVTYGLRVGTIDGFNQRIQSIESIRELV